MDIMLLAALASCVIFLCVYYAIDAYGSPYRLLALSIAAYASFMALLAETAARMRDAAFAGTLHWKRFFGAYGITKPFGLLMALFLFCLIAYLLILCPIGVIAFRLSKAGMPLLLLLYRIAGNKTPPWQISVPVYLFFMLCLILQAYICKFVMRLADESESANREKIRAERFKTELITNVSHDIRTPLTAIVSYADLMRSLPIDNADFAAYADVLQRKSTRLKTLIDDLLEASKAGTGSLSVDMQEIGLSEIVGQIAGEFDDQFGERGLTLVIRQPGTPVCARADRRHIWRALENLFSNAVKYAMPGTRVFAEIAERGGAPVFTLKNTSRDHIDMTGDMLAEQFIRGDRARQTEGSGLGLYIAKCLVELMGGSFAIRASGDLFEAEIVFPLDA
jgi:signal transduction histidine kinase